GVLEPAGGRVAHGRARHDGLRQAQAAVRRSAEDSPRRGPVARRVLPQLPLGDPEEREELQAHSGAVRRAARRLDRVTSARWLGGAVRGDFGKSLAMDVPITPLLMERLGYSLRLAIPALVLGVTISLVLGIVAATRRNGIVDHLITMITLTGVSVPAFVLGSVLILVFAGWLRWLPSSSALAEGSGPGYWA